MKYVFIVREIVVANFFVNHLTHMTLFRIGVWGGRVIRPENWGRCQNCAQPPTTWDIAVCGRYPAKFVSGHSAKFNEGLAGLHVVKFKFSEGLAHLNVLELQIEGSSSGPSHCETCNSMKVQQTVMLRFKERR